MKNLQPLTHKQGVYLKPMYSYHEKTSSYSLINMVCILITCTHTARKNLQLLTHKHGMYLKPMYSYYKKNI